MGSLRVTVCTSILAAVALAPAAYAADAGSVAVTPAAPAPGSDVTLRVTGCAQRTAVAASAAFVADARLTVTGARELTGESRVRSTLRAGSYAVQVTCGDTRRTGTLTVQDGEAGRSRAAPPPVPGAGGQPPAPGKGGQPSAPGVDGEAHRPSTPASPVAPVRAGGGGAAALVAAEERGTGPGTAQGVTGLVLAGAAAVAVALRGVRRGRGTD
ncbi:hypothetical protein ACFU3E_08000 [Streptomyces sp. NPDC057424]|uniref:hypothetical protein n=1 Tax=Streptomyces sp. NPDC057424 TaxID=3346127 RepID=UPI0036A242AD